MQPAQRPAGIRAELVEEPQPHGLVSGQGVGLPPAPVQGEHQLAGQPLVQRVRRRLRGQLGEQLGMPAGAQRPVVAVELGGEPLGVEGVADLVRPRGVQGGERLPAPEAQGLIEDRRALRRVVGRAGLGDEPAEPVQVHRHRVRRQDVAPERRVI